jgi:hypothetical protein
VGWHPLEVLLPVLERLNSSGSYDQEEALFVGPHNISSADILSIPGTEPMPSLNPEVWVSLINFKAKGLTTPSF